MTDQERIERLEKQYERLYHETELLFNEIIKIHHWINNHVKIDKNFSRSLLDRIEGIKNYSIVTDTQLQEHFKSVFYSKRR